MDWIKAVKGIWKSTVFHLMWYFWRKKSLKSVVWTELLDLWLKELRHSHACRAQQVSAHVCKSEAVK